jgi:chromate transporter
VIANLALYFALHTLFGEVEQKSWGPLTVQVPDLSSLRPVAVVIGAVAAVLLFRLNWPVLRTLGLCALLGIVASLLGLPLT